MSQKLEALKDKLKDERSGKVIFVAHCILNENTIYLGGAFRKGSVDEVVDRLQRAGIGIVQMKCPEQGAWGGILKKTMWMGLGPKNTMHSFRKIYLPLFIMYTRWKYRRLAKEIAEEVKDYRDSGFEVVGIMGIRGSPSCGVKTTMDLVKSAEYLVNTSVNSIDRDAFNEEGIRGCWKAGSGFFITALRNELEKKGLEIEFLEHDHFSEAS